MLLENSTHIYAIDMIAATPMQPMSLPSYIHNKKGSDGRGGGTCRVFSVARRSRSRPAGIQRGRVSARRRRAFRRFSLPRASCRPLRRRPRLRCDAQDRHERKKMCVCVLVTAICICCVEHVSHEPKLIRLLTLLLFDMHPLADPAAVVRGSNKKYTEYATNTSSGASVAADVAANGDRKTTGGGGGGAGAALLAATAAASATGTGSGAAAAAVPTSAASSASN